MHLFEYQNRIAFPGSTTELEKFLEEIWKKRDRNQSWYKEDEISVADGGQPFIRFFHQSTDLKSGKYVGVLFHEGHRINLLPKIFFNDKHNYTEENIQQIQHHILWWLSYCRRIKFPNYQTELGNVGADFFEVLIYQFSKYTLNLLHSSLFQQYEEVSNEVSFFRGRLNTEEYIGRNLASGNFHKLNCRYEHFTPDNTFNQVVKHVSSLLFDVSKLAENKKLLGQILFLLDDVRDVPVTASMCAGIRFNPMFQAFETVRDYCLLFLENSVAFGHRKSLKLFAFLLPMEYLFEDFVAGFIRKELPGIEFITQSTGTYLDQNNIFGLRPDLCIRLNNRKLVVDTKYKLVFKESSDPKKGISQQDMYQMLAYAIRFKADEVWLFYPSVWGSALHENTSFQIQDPYSDRIITIKAIQIPVLDEVVIAQIPASKQTLQALFQPARDRLKGFLEDLLVLPQTSVEV